MLNEHRAYIIESSLQIERNLSLLLGNLLFVGDIDISKTLGNKSTSLSFNQKTDILLDTDFISDDDRKKFQLFMEIRNQFAHNKNCNTYNDCMSIVESCEKRLNKYYKLETHEAKENEKLELKIRQLINELNAIIYKCQEKHIENLRDFLKAEYYSKAYDELVNSLIQNITRIDKLIDFKIEPENLKKLKDNLLLKIVDESANSIKPKLLDIQVKMEKRKYRKLE